MTPTCQSVSPSGLLQPEDTVFLPPLAAVELVDRNRFASEGIGVVYASRRFTFQRGSREDLGRTAQGEATGCCYEGGEKSEPGAEIQSTVSKAAQEEFSATTTFIPV